MPKKITLRELQTKLLDPEIPESELAEFFEIDPERSGAFAPAIRPIPSRVDDEGLEGDILLRFFNSASRARRELQYRLRLAKPGTPHIKIVSEGDSWFQYPLLLKDVIDQLHEREDLAIRSLGAAGDLLRDIIAENELTRVIEKEEPELFLISGGGNDMLGGGRLSTLLHSFESGRKADDYPNADFDEFLTDISDLYRGLFARLTTRFPNLKILCHGYDRGVPDRGRWLGKPMEKLGIKERTLQIEIAAVITNRFNLVLAELSHEFGGSVWHVDCIGTVSDDRWFDELHPDNSGFADVAARFSDTIDLALAHRREFRARCPGREAFRADAKPLSDSQRWRLVAHRARRIAGTGFERIHTEQRAKELRAEVTFVQERLHLGADFLPARFLQDGASRAKAVCRIKTPTSLGSGFMIAAPHFIMTNNHVLPNRAIAGESLAEFELTDDESPITVQLRPDRFFVTDETLDYTIVGCDTAGLAEVIPVPLLRNPMTIGEEEQVNIVQHPRGRKKEIAIHNNRTVEVVDRFVRYRTDTEPGSSGSAVFNNDWELVALHHAGQQGSGGTALNEGIRMAAIVAHLLRGVRNESASEAREILDLVSDTSPYFGFFDVVGVADDGLEVELPDFGGTAEFADVGFWNIENFNNGVDAQRVGRVADVLNRLAMDAIGLTEVQSGALHQLVSALRSRGQNADFVVKNVPGSQDIAVLFDADTTTVDLADDLSGRFRSQLSTRTPGGRTAFPRHPLFARCKVHDGEGEPVEFLMIVVHLKAFGDPTSRARRRLAAGILAEIIEEIRSESDLPIILGGDFNEQVNNDVLSGLTRSPDLVTLTTDDQDNNAASYIGGTRRSLIDHIIISRDVRPGDIAGDDAAIIRLDRSVADFARNVSDHVPVVMRIVLRAAPIDTPDTGDEEGGTTLMIPDGANEVTVQFEY